MDEQDPVVILATACWGAFGWQQRIADEYQVHRSTVSRWRESGNWPADLHGWLTEEAARKAAELQTLAAG